MATLIRLLVRAGSDGSAARRVLDLLTGHGSPTFWPDDIAYGSIDPSPVVGRAQVTDSGQHPLREDRQGHAHGHVPHPRVNHLENAKPPREAAENVGILGAK